jgi:hypothetical protein
MLKVKVPYNLTGATGFGVWLWKGEAAGSSKWSGRPVLLFCRRRKVRRNRPWGRPLAWLGLLFRRSKGV